MFDARAPLHGPLDYSNPSVTPAPHTHSHIHTGDLRLGLRRRRSSGGSDESFDRRTQPQERRRR